MIKQGKLTKSWHRNPLVIRHTMFFIPGDLPLIAHCEPEFVCLLPEVVDRVTEVIPFHVTSKNGREIKV